MTDKSSKIKQNILLFMLKEVIDNVNALFSLLYFMRLYTSFNSLSQNVELAAIKFVRASCWFPGFILILRFLSSLWLSLPLSFLTLSYILCQLQETKNKVFKTCSKQKEYKNSLSLIRLSITVVNLVAYKIAINLQRKKIRNCSNCFNVPSTLEWVP